MSATTYAAFDNTVSQHKVKGWVPASGLQSDQVKEKTKPRQIYAVPLVWRNYCYIGYCEITRSTFLQCETVSIPSPFAVPGTQQGD